VSQTLGGGASYELNWAATHNDFRVKINFGPSAGNRYGGTPPTISVIGLEGASSGGDRDQNQKTYWTLTDGVYDRSGNQYEGDVMTTYYGQ